MPGPRTTLGCRGVIFSKSWEAASWSSVSLIGRLPARKPDAAATGPATSLPQDISAWLHVNENGEVTVFTGKVEVGQNIRTSLTQAVAEELRVTPGSIHLLMGDTDRVPFDMGTFGSRTTPTMNPQLRRAAAAAREVLIGLAADAWKVDPAKLTAANGAVTDPDSQRTASYAELAKGRELAKVIPAEDPLTPAAQWKVMDKPLGKVTGREIVTGRHRYPSDIKLPEMLYGKVLRPPAFGATLSSLDASKAQQMPGVTVVHDGNFVGVAAPSPHVAQDALAALSADVEVHAAKPPSDELFEYLKKNAETGDDRNGHAVGSVEKGLADASLRLKQTYTVAYIAHAPLEPRAAVAEWKDGKLTVWTGTQRPFGVRGELAEAFRLPRGPRASDDAGHGFGLRWQAHRRSGRGSGAPGPSRAPAREAGVDARGGIHLGLLSPCRRHRSFRRRRERRRHHRLGVSQLQFRRGGHRHPLQHSQSAHSVSSCRFAPAPGLVPIARRSGQPFRARILHGRTRATWPKWTRSNSGSRTSPMRASGRRSKPRRRNSAGGKELTRGCTAEDHGFGIAGGFDKGGYVATCAEVAVDSSHAAGARGARRHGV